MTTPAAWTLEGVTVRRGSRLVLDVPNLEIARGSVLALVGPNGSGKTTLLRVLALLLAPATGTIRFFGRAVSNEAASLRREVTLVDRSPFLFRRSVEANVAWGLRVRGIASRDRIAEALERVDLAGFSQRPASRLSSGETQRVALARALAIDPPAILLDEPTASVDRVHVPLIEKVIRELVDKGTTVVLATHDAAQADRVSDDILALEEGRLSRSVSLNRLRGNVHRDGEIRLEIAPGVFIELGTDPGASTVSIGIAPEEILVSTEPLRSSARNTLSGKITAATDDGRGLLITVDCGVPIAARVTRHSWRELRLEPGAKVWLTFKTSALRFL